MFRAIVFLSVYLFVTFSVAQETLKVAVGATDYPPYYFKDNDSNKYIGISVEVCQIVAKRLGYNLTFKSYPFARVLEILKNGSADLVCNLFNTPKRSQLTIFTGVPHTFESVSLFVKYGSSVHWDGLNLKQLENYSFGGVRGYSFGKAYDQSTTLNKQVATDEKSQIRMLLANRFDIALGNKPTVLYHAKKLKIEDQLTFLSPILSEWPVYIGISRKRADANRIASLFTQEIVKLRASDDYQQLLKKYALDTPLY